MTDEIRPSDQDLETIRLVVLSVVSGTKCRIYRNAEKSCRAILCGRFFPVLVDMDAEQIKTFFSVFGDAYQLSSGVSWPWRIKGTQIGLQITEAIEFTRNDWINFAYQLLVLIIRGSGSCGIRDGQINQRINEVAALELSPDSDPNCCQHRNSRDLNNSISRTIITRYFKINFQT